MGDSGSMLLGLVLSASALTLTGQFAVDRPHPGRRRLGGQPAADAAADHPAAVDPDRAVRRPACSPSYAAPGAARSPFAPGQAAPAPPAARDRPLPPPRGADHVAVGRADRLRRGARQPLRRAAGLARARRRGSRSTVVLTFVLPVPPGRGAPRRRSARAPDRRFGGPQDFVLIFTSGSEGRPTALERTAADMTTAPPRSTATSGASVLVGAALAALVVGLARRPGRRARRRRPRRRTARWSAPCWWSASSASARSSVHVAAGLVPAASLLVALLTYTLQVLRARAGLRGALALGAARRRPRPALARRARSSPAPWPGWWPRSCSPRGCGSRSTTCPTDRRRTVRPCRRGRPDDRRRVRDDHTLTAIVRGAMGQQKPRPGSDDEQPAGRPVARLRLPRGRVSRVYGLIGWAAGPVAGDDVPGRRSGSCSAPGWAST